MRSTFVVGSGLALILAGNHLVRRTLEHTRLPYYPSFPNNKAELRKMAEA